MSNQSLLQAGALAVLSAAAVLMLPHAHAAGQEAMVVVRDPQTGELRAPTGAEAQALNSKATLQRQAPFQPVESVGPGGSRKVRLGKNALVYSVVTRSADGKLAEQCVTGEQAAEAALTHPLSPKEPRHESE